MASQDFARLVEATKTRREQMTRDAAVQRRSQREADAWQENARRDAAARASRPTMRAEVFGGAQMGRLFRDWVTPQPVTQREIRADIRVLRARARQLVRDNAIAAGFVNEFAMQVIGPKEIRLQAKIRRWEWEFATATNDEIERGWKRWGHPETRPSIVAQLA
jgi:capsid protein